MRDRMLSGAAMGRQGTGVRRVGIQDRDYMRERARQARASERTQWSAGGSGRGWSLGGSGTLSRVLVFGMAIVLVFLAVKYLDAYRNRVPFPATGDVHWYVNDERPRVARLTLRARESSPDRYFAVMLEDWATRSPVAMIPVRAGESSVTLLPLGRYRMTTAKGSVWMGPDRRFGISGDSKVVVHPVEFYQRGDQVFGHEIDLAVPFAGNLQTAPDLAPTPWR